MIQNFVPVVARYTDKIRVPSTQRGRWTVYPRHKHRPNHHLAHARHCRVADIQNVAQVALEAGNSPAMIFGHYRELVTADDPKTWFAIAPKQPANIVRLPGRVTMPKGAIQLTPPDSRDTILILKCRARFAN
jgi:hypothetical protein